MYSFSNLAASSLSIGASFLAAEEGTLDVVLVQGVSRASFLGSSRLRMNVSSSSSLSTTLATSAVRSALSFSTVTACL